MNNWNPPSLAPDREGYYLCTLEGDFARFVHPMYWSEYDWFGPKGTPLCAMGQLKAWMALPPAYEEEPIDPDTLVQLDISDVIHKTGGGL